MTNDTFTVRAVVLGLVAVVVVIIVALIVVLVTVTLTPEQTGGVISALTGIGGTALGALAALLAHTVTGASSISVTPAANAQAVTVTDAPVVAPAVRTE